MKRRRAKKAILHAHGSAYIDPMHCGSTVGYRVVESAWGTLTMEVRLSDCTRQVMWEFREESQTPATLKFDVAIAALTEAREAWVASLAKYKARKRQRKRRSHG